MINGLQPADFWEPIHGVANSNAAVYKRNAIIRAASANLRFSSLICSL